MTACLGLEPSGHRLQAMLLDADRDRQALYWRQIDAAGGSVVDAPARAIRPFHHLLFDTLLNSFYERYWRDLTALITLKLSVETSGSCRIRIVRRVAGGSEAILAETVAHGSHVRSVLAISLERLPDDDAVIHASVEAFEEAVVFHEGVWLTDAPARNEIRLAIVICSLGREAMLVDNLSRIAPTVARTAAISALLVIRQGGADLAAFGPYQQLATHAAFGDKLRLVHQDNFGGTGGFVRGALESLEASATHVLLLDDDIRVEPAVLERLTVLLGRLTAPTTIGGQMLDLGRPTVLHASHEGVDLGRLRLRNPCVDIDLGVPHAADLFAHRHVSAYNAWWFCCIPASLFREVGLPLPMFIRHDDIEYGVRTVAAGAPLVTMPGIFVWHAPFTAKNVTPPFVYYERRNFMITAAVHGEAHPLQLVRCHWRDAWVGLRRHRYDYCWALCRAVDDFLAGPNVVFSNIRERHRRLTSDQARFVLLAMSRARHHAANPRAISVLRVLFWPFPTRDRAEARFASVVRDLAFAIVRTSLSLLWRGRRVAATYRAEAPAYTTETFWRHLLGLTPEPGSLS